VSSSSHLTAVEHRRIADAVARAEKASAGEIVTVVADRSDGYTDVALAWSALAALFWLSALAVAPGVFLQTIGRFSGGWNQDWTVAGKFTLAAVMATALFTGVMLLQSIPGLRFRSVPGPIKARRVHERALAAFGLGVERRTAG